MVRNVGNACVAIRATFRKKGIEDSEHKLHIYEQKQNKSQNMRIVGILESDGSSGDCFIHKMLHGNLPTSLCFGVTTAH